MFFLKTKHVHLSDTDSIWKQPIGWFNGWRENAEVLHHCERKMAAYRYGYSAVLFILCGLSVFLVTNGQETILTGDDGAAAVDSPQTVTETAEQTAEQPAVEERQWEVTEVEEASPDEAAADKQDASAPETLVPPSVPRPKDDFQEELVIRPLHSGDIYASFQFRTLWETDFMRGNKGKLTASSVINTCC